ncbi:MAG: methionyl-tRNA formyltransferase [Chloroflexi bacterium]|nr:methionyl-tRNA formyltransferase [Chloroflexota bacterium]
MRVVFMGTPQYAVPVLEELQAASSTEVVAVYTPPDRPRGRGREIETTPVKAAALELGIPVCQPVSFRSEEVREELASFLPDVVVVAAYGKLLPASVLELPPHGCLNIHPSLLPRYRGPSPVVSAILDGVAETGVSLMLLDEGMDTGPIVAQETYPLNGTETALFLTEELFMAGGKLLVDRLQPWVEGKLPLTAQEDSLATVTSKLERSDGAADWTQSAEHLERLQRAFTPWPGLFTQWEDKTLRLLEVCVMQIARQSGESLAPEPGEVVGLDQEDILVGIGTGEGILGLKTLQLEGRRATSASEFLRGYPHFLGSQL